MKRFYGRGAPYFAALVPFLALSGSACSRADRSTLAVQPELPAADPANAGASSTPDGSSTPLYALSSLVFGADNTTTYVSLLDSLGDQTVDFANAREFSGTSDLWVNDGRVFVADGEALTITRYVVQGKELVANGSVSFGAYGLTSLGFWLNEFINPSKAYLFNGASEVIIWNPDAMEITGTIELPDLPGPAGLKLFNGYSDRAAVVRDGRLYQPYYWTDDSYFQYAPNSAIAVFDVATDTLADVLDVPCPGLDHATLDETGDIYFSPWVYAPGGAAVLHQPDTCVVRVPSGDGEPSVAFHFPDVTDGRQGGVLRYIGNRRALMSVLHAERVTLSPSSDPSDVAFAANWRFWTYDLDSGAASPVEAIDWNAGAQYSFDIDGRTLMLVALADYSSTNVYDVGDGSHPTPAFVTPGWSVRLFKIR